MDCDFTEEVSLLVDGELAPQEAARLRAHVEGCAACRQAREAFLLLRQELRAYDFAPDPNVQSAALASILASRTSEGNAAASSPGIRTRPSTTRRARVSGWLGSLAEAFGGGLRPAHVATLAVLLIATALGLRWFMGSSTSPSTHQAGAPAAANTNSAPVQATADAGGKKPETPDAVGLSDVDSPVNYQAKTQKPTRPAGTRQNARRERENAQVRGGEDRTIPQRREGLSRELPREVARVGEPALLPSSVNVAAMYAAGSLRADDDPASRIGRHAERVERLLRSFRNASLAASDPTLDVADARRLSKRLLYSNIALRREAASAGDLPVEGLLDSVEPILIDIANLPNAPSPDAVGSIKERIQRRQLVGALQAQGMSASR